MSAQRHPVLDPLVALTARVAVLEAEVARLRRTSGPRDRLDFDVLHALAEETGGLPFRSREIFDRIEADAAPGIAAVCEEAFIGSSRALGKLLTRCHGLALPDGLQVERLMLRGRPCWRVSVSSV